MTTQKACHQTRGSVGRQMVLAPLLWCSHTTTGTCKRCKCTGCSQSRKGLADRSARRSDAHPGPFHKQFCMLDAGPGRGWRSDCIS